MEILNIEIYHGFTMGILHSYVVHKAARGYVAKKVRAELSKSLYIVQENKNSKHLVSGGVLPNQLTTSQSYKLATPPTTIHARYYCECIVVGGDAGL